MVSAICPNCNILLGRSSVGATSALSTAEQYATAHANYVSNSWSGNEGYEDATTATTTSAASRSRPRPATAVTTARRSGPRFCRRVIAVGGTSLTQDQPAHGVGLVAARGAAAARSTRSRASRAGSTPDARGAPRPTRRPIADPSTGVAVYDSYRQSGWLVFGGTSVATPIVASVFALAGNTGANNRATSTRTRRASTT